MTEIDTRTLKPGQTVVSDNGERTGRSQGGHLVMMRRRRTETGFVVTVDAPRMPDLSTETIAYEWGIAAAAFDRLMAAC